MKHLILYIIVMTVAVSCSKKSDPAQQDTTSATAETSSPNEVVLTEEQLKSVSPQLGSVEKRQMSNTVKASGMLDVPPQNMVTISAPLGGFIKHTELLQGMKVKKGQVLLTMEHPDYVQLQQDYLDGKSQLEFLALEYQRQQDLATENVNSVKTLQQSKSNYFSTKARVEGLKAKLRLVNINPDELEAGAIRNTVSIPSPITGFVTQVNINPGMHVNPTDVMLKIVDTEHLHAEAQVFEKDISKLQIGQAVRITLSNETKERTARVYLIGKEISRDRTVRVHCHLDQEDPTLIPGMYFTAIIETEAKLSDVLPTAALVSYEGKDYVFISDRTDTHRFEMIEVERGASEGQYSIVVIPESAMNKSVVVKGTYALLGLLKNKEE